MFMTPHLDSYCTTDPKPKILLAAKTGKRNSCDGRNVCSEHIQRDQCSPGNSASHYSDQSIMKLDFLAT